MMARPPIELTEAQKVEVENLAAVLTSEQTADYFGIGRRTFYDMMARDAEIAARYKRGKARTVGSVAQNLIARARAGNVTAMIFYLKTQAGWSETAALEVTGLEADQMRTIDPSRPSSGTLRELLEVQADADAVVARMAHLHKLAQERDGSVGLDPHQLPGHRS